MRLLRIAIASAPAVMMCATLVAPASQALPTESPSGPSNSTTIPDVQPIEKAHSLSIASEAQHQQAQCAKTLGQRVGPWTCTESQSGTPANTETAAQAAIGAATTATAGSVGFCRISPISKSCWEPVPATAKTHGTGTTVNLTGTYGYGKQVLGNIGFHATTVFNGAKQITKNMWFRSSRGTRNVELATDFLRLTGPHPEGQVIRRAGWSEVFTGFHQAGIAVSEPWNRHEVYNSESDYISIMHYAGWEDSSSTYPGHWYAYIKSIRMKKNSNGQYLNEGLSLPDHPSSAGWSIRN